MSSRKKVTLLLVYFLATVQFAWCYFWLTRPYVNTQLYELGQERMPFQGRMLMILPMRLADSSIALRWAVRFFAQWRFWFPRLAHPEVLMQAMINVICLLVAGYCTTQIYQGSSERRLLTWMVYPLMLVACAATYVMHTVQNFRFIYDLPSLAFFAAAMHVIYFRKHWAYFAVLFVVATVNRETTLLLLPLYVIDAAVVGRMVCRQRICRARTLFVVIPLAVFWVAWQLFVRHHFAQNASEFYPRLNWNVKSLLAPIAWPQMLSASAYLLLFVVVMRRRIADPQLQAWFWIIPLWFVFMFVYGILIETRVFGELIPFLVCASALILEEMLVERVQEVSGAEEDEELAAMSRAA